MFKKTDDFDGDFYFKKDNSDCPENSDNQDNTVCPGCGQVHDKIGTTLESVSKSQEDFENACKTVLANCGVIAPPDGTPGDLERKIDKLAAARSLSKLARLDDEISSDMQPHVHGNHKGSLAIDTESLARICIKVFDAVSECPNDSMMLLMLIHIGIFALNLQSEKEVLAGNANFSNF